MAPHSPVPRDRSGSLATRAVLVPRSATLSSGAKAGISLGCIFGAAILLCVAWPFIARLWRRWKGEKPTYHPSFEDPAHNRPAVTETGDVDRRLSLKNLEDQQGLPPGAAFDSQKTTPGAGPQQSPFDPNFDIPPHYRDHPDYLAHQAALAAAAASAGSGSGVPQPSYVDGGTPGQVPIETPSSRFEQLKDNAKNKIAWSADKAQFIKKALHDIKREGEVGGMARSPGHLDDGFGYGARRQFPGWLPSIFHSQGAGPSARPHGTTLAPGHSQPAQPLSPAYSAPSPPVSSRMDEAFDGQAQQDSTLLSGGKTGLPSPPTVNQASFDPKLLWDPTNQSERQHVVNHELVMLETAPSTGPSASASPPPQPPPEPPSSPDQLRPQPTPAEHLDPRTPTPQPVSTPQTHDIEMADGGSDFSTPHDRLFAAMSNQDTPASGFTESEFNTASPKSNGYSEMNYASPMPPERPEYVPGDTSDITSPAGPSSAASPEDPSSAASPQSYTCDECGKTFEQIHRLNHHKRYHERKHECTVEGCNKKFGTKTHLDRHINDKHKKTRKFYCTEPSCPYSIQGGKSFPRKDNWVRHIRKKHRNLSISQADAQGFLVDEEMGTAQSVAAPPSQNMAQMRYGMPMGMAMPMGGGMGHIMNNGMPMGMGGMGGMNMQQPPIPPGAGFNSPWHMGGPHNGY